LEIQAQMLTTYHTFATMVRTQYDSSIRVFRADTVGEYLFRPLCHFLSKQDTLSTRAPVLMLKMVFRKHHHLHETTFALLLATLFLLSSRLKLSLLLFIL
jgi:hypothetical protein